MGYIIVLARKLRQDNKGRLWLWSNVKKQFWQYSTSDFSLLFRDTLNKQTEYRYDLLNADYDQSKTKDFTIKKCMFSFMSQVKLPQD